MKKRILSGLLAAVLLLGTAFAAGGDALPTAETAADTTLTFAVTLPDGMDTMTERRLAQLELYEAVFALNDERTVLTVTLPEGTEAPDGLADFLTQPNVLSIKDAAGTVSLTGADILSAEAGQAAESEPRQRTRRRRSALWPRTTHCPFSWTGRPSVKPRPTTQTTRC